MTSPPRKAERPLSVLLPPLPVFARGSSDSFLVADEAVAASLRYIASFKDGRANVELVAQHVDLSLRSLELRFRRTLGRSPAQEITRVGIERARHMLQYEHTSVRDVARLAGYTNLSAFTRAFRKLTGSTPAAFRRAARAT